MNSLTHDRTMSVISSQELSELYQTYFKIVECQQFDQFLNGVFNV